jgi:crossover junction endodeoxyribonuclease RusA
MNEETIEIILPMPARVLSPNTTIGSIAGRMMKSSATKRYRRLAMEAIEAEQIETMPWKRASVSAHFFFARNGRRDPDNLMGWIKSAYDGFVDAGLIPDDDSKHLRREEPTFDIDKEYPRVELTITRCY